MKPVSIHLDPDSRPQGRRTRSWQRDRVSAIHFVHSDLQGVVGARRLRPERRYTAADKQQKCGKPDRIHPDLADPVAVHRILR
jgi:hypothetical protein